MSNDWRDQVMEALDAYRMVVRLAGATIEFSDIRTEFLDAAHRPPTSLPVGQMAIYGFYWDGVWLKIGKAGPQSQARYTSQHYNPASAPSTLAASLLRDSRMSDVPDFDVNSPGDWIKSRCCRANILVPAQHGRALLSLLETFLHVRLNPRYEG